MFGDFDDLTPDEHERIQHILHGYKEPSAKKVEFPWDDSTIEGAMAGPDVYYGSPEMEYGGVYAEMPPYPVEMTTQEEALQTYQGEQYQEYTYSGNTERRDSDQTFGATVNPGMGDMDTTQDLSPNPSKLQASLKSYERRNKKKRPPGYYNQGENGSADNLQGMVRSEVHVSLSNKPEGATYSEIKNENVVETNINMNDPSGHHYSAPPYQNIGDVHYMQGASVRNAQNSAIDADVNTQYSGTKMEELKEVIVESVPYSNSQGHQEMDSKQIQDHDRTTGLTQPLTNSSNSNVFTHSSSVSSDTNNVFVSKLQIPNLSSPNKIEVPRNDSMVHSTNSSQVSESFQVSNEGNEKFTNNEFSFGTQQPNSDNSNPSSDTKVVDVDATISVDGSETTAKDTNKPDIIDSNVTMATSEESHKPPQPSPWGTKPTSWASLFKSSSASSNTAPSVVQTSEPAKEDNSNDKETDETNEREVSPMPVSAAEDKEAKQLGELLSKMTISHSSVALQPRGLVNRANWCYINGTLQALVACPPFYNLLKKLPRYPALSRGPSSTPILDSLVEFVHEFQPMARNMDKGPKKGVRDVNPGSPFEPSYVYRMLQAIQVNPHFKLGKQEDAEEFLTCILDGMHEEMSAAVTLLNKNDKAEPLEDGYTNGYAAGETDEDEEMVADAWEQVGPKKKSVQTRRAEFAKSPIADIFAGMIRSVVYKALAKETATLQPFFTLQLDIQSEKVWTLKDALEGFVSKEQISGYNCTKTNTEVEVIKKLFLEELPPVLILHLKFFVYNKDGGSQKLMKKVDYPVELEITKDFLSPTARSKLNQQQRSYKLFAVVYHHGKTSTGGHYTTSVFHPGINGWVNSDDSTIKTVFVRDVLKYTPQRVPYLLYYRRLDSH